MLQPAHLRRELRTNKTQLVKEYALVMKLGEVDETSDFLFEEAVRYLQVCLLSDLRPPWADYTFLQALPGDGTLSRYTRPCFLLWEVSDAANLFGDEVMSKLNKVAADVSLEVVAVLGRPRYVCTARPHEKTQNNYACPQRRCHLSCSCLRHGSTTCAPSAITSRKHQSLTVLLCEFCSSTSRWPPRMDNRRLCG